MLESKRRIAKRAVLVKFNDCIFPDHSTTVYEICEEILHMPLMVMNRLPKAANIRLVTLGGDFDIVRQGFFRPEADRL
ncbi:MAG: hypothetical protein HFG75_12390 [Hungatella sp.]|nr:hypothetical protein [Hungatella sp.]